MSKYIDADKLIAEIERRREICADIAADERNEEVAEYYYGKEVAHDEISSLVTSLQQEQPEIGLEKFTEKVKTFQARYKHSESISVKGAMAFMARMFYQYPNVARQWYEQLPKATMDFSARKEK